MSNGYFVLFDDDAFYAIASGELVFLPLPGAGIRQLTPGVYDLDMRWIGELSDVIRALQEDEEVEVNL